MKIDRRVFLKLSIGAGILGYFGYRLLHRIFPYHFISKEEKKTLSSYLDTLIPEDSMPSASQAGVPVRIWDMAGKTKDYKKLLIDGCNWLDWKARKKGGKNYYSLNEEARRKIVAIAVSSKKGSLPSVFFNRTRYDAYFLYYGNKAAWKGLAYHGPPQPGGFPDYDIPQGGST